MEEWATDREDFERVAPYIVLVPALHVVDAHEETIVHDIQLLQQLRVAPDLLRKESALLRPELERFAAVDPVQVLQRGTRVLLCLLLRVLPANSRAFEVERLVNIAMRREEVVHDHEVDLTAPRQLHTVQAVEAAQQCVRIRLDMLVVRP